MCSPEQRNHPPPLRPATGAHNGWEKNKTVFVVVSVWALCVVFIVQTGNKSPKKYRASPKRVCRMQRNAGCSTQLKTESGRERERAAPAEGQRRQGAAAPKLSVCAWRAPPVSLQAVFKSRSKLRMHTSYTSPGRHARLRWLLSSAGRWKVIRPMGGLEGYSPASQLQLDSFKSAPYSGLFSSGVYATASAAASALVGSAAASCAEAATGAAASTMGAAAAAAAAALALAAK